MDALSLKRGMWWFQKRWSGKNHASAWPVEDYSYSSAQSMGDYSSAELELWKSAMGQYQFLQTMFWQQANFFIVIQAALLSVVASQFFLKGEEKLWPLLL